MKKCLLLALAWLGICGLARAEFVGAEFPLTTGTPDGWSGIPVMYGHQLPAGQSVNAVHYYAADDRVAVEEGLYHVVPLIVRQEGGSLEGDGDFSVWEVGPAHTPMEIGEQKFNWGSSPIPNDGSLYHPAALQWQQDVNDSAGGVIAFATNGEGMHYFNVDTTSYIPNEDLGEVEKGLELSPLETHSSAAGGRHYQLTFETGSSAKPGDFNSDSKLDATDINDLSGHIRQNGTDKKFDVNSDNKIDQADRTAWVKTLRKTWFGDANLNGEFNSADFVEVFQGGLYETERDATWQLGDWDGDARFNSSDFVAAFQDGGYEKGPIAATVAGVPEPSSIALVLSGMLGLLSFGSRRASGILTTKDTKSTKDC